MDAYGSKYLERFIENYSGKEFDLMGITAAAVNAVEHGWENARKAKEISLARQAITLPLSNVIRS